MLLADKICKFHIARISNGSTEALNNLITCFGYGFTNYRVLKLTEMLGTRTS